MWQGCSVVFETYQLVNACCLFERSHRVTLCPLRETCLDKNERLRSNKMNTTFQTFELIFQTVVQMFLKKKNPGKITVLDVIVEVMPGASLRHRERHLSVNGTFSLRRGKTHLLCFTERNSCWRRKSVFRYMRHRINMHLRISFVYSKYFHSRPTSAVRA